jgi:hypothetical protein
VAGQEDESQRIVLDIVDLRVEVGHQLLLSLELGVTELFGLATKVVGATEVVDASALSGGHQPGGRVDRYANDGPLLEGGQQCVLGEILRELDVAGDPGEGADETG